MSVTVIETCEDHDDGEACTARATEYSPAGRALCQRHANRFWDQRLRIERDYPDSSMAPSWFDPANAGEHWDSDW